MAIPADTEEKELFRARHAMSHTKKVAFGGTRTHANKVDYDLNVAP